MVVGERSVVDLPLNIVLGNITVTLYIAIVPYSEEFHEGIDIL